VPSCRWARERKIGYNIFDCDKLVFPINWATPGNGYSHWTFIIVHKRSGGVVVFSYDSFLSPKPAALDAIAKFLRHMWALEPPSWAQA